MAVPLRLFLCRGVVTDRGIDQILPQPGLDRFHPVVTMINLKTVATTSGKHPPGEETHSGMHPGNLPALMGSGGDEKGFPERNWPSVLNLPVSPPAV